jgi:argonaute-like protein implicated in RNA metabolism and viral defense
LTTVLIHVTAKIPDKGIAMIDEENNSSVLSTWGAPESQATSKYTGIPRPIQVSKKEGDTDIETLTKQVYLLAQAHIGVSNTTIRLPITTAYADKAGEAAINGWLVESDDDLSTQLGFL